MSGSVNRDANTDANDTGVDAGATATDATLIGVVTATIADRDCAESDSCASKFEARNARGLLYPGCEKNRLPGFNFGKRSMGSHSFVLSNNKANFADENIRDFRWKADPMEMPELQWSTQHG